MSGIWSRKNSGTTACAEFGTVEMWRAVSSQKETGIAGCCSLYQSQADGVRVWQLEGNNSVGEYRQPKYHCG